MWCHYENDKSIGQWAQPYSHVQCFHNAYRAGKWEVSPSGPILMSGVNAGDQHSAIEAELLTNCGGWGEVWLAVHTVLCSCHKKQLLTCHSDKRMETRLFFSQHENKGLVSISNKSLRGLITDFYWRVCGVSYTYSLKFIVASRATHCAMSGESHIKGFGSQVL